jgi:molybdopterin molybdotransferase
VFSLPGNPASAFVTFELFVRPFLLRLMGHRGVHRRVIRCLAGTELSAPATLTYLLRVRVDTSRIPPRATPVGPQGSGLVRSLAAAQGLALIPEGVDAVEEGEAVDVMLLDEGASSVEATPAP